MGIPIVQVTTTAPSEEVAEQLATVLLESRLAACVQVGGPVRSRYWWRGALEESTEWVCTAKTTALVADRAVAAIRAAHPYEVAEVLVVPVTGGSDAYLEWIAAEVAPS